MTISEILTKGKEILNKVSDAPLLEAEVLFSFVSGKRREYLLANYDTDVSDESAKKFFSLIRKRKAGIPLPYLTNVKEFMALDFYVDENVLIPRQETETLVEEALKTVNGKKAKVLDIGTGSGCILIAFLFYNKLSYGMGIDISEKAIEIALKNARSNGVENRAKFVVSDFLLFNTKEKFDLILSNPPYVRSSELSEVPFEPEIALDGGEDGMKFYRKITEKAYSFLEPDGIFITEIDYRNSDRVVRIFEQSDFKKVKTIKDLAGKERFVEGIK